MTLTELDAIRARDAAPLSQQVVLDALYDRRRLLAYVDELRKTMEHYGMETEHACMCQFVNDTDTLSSECHYHEQIRLRAEQAEREGDALKELLRVMPGYGLSAYDRERWEQARNAALEGRT